jgi:hypothetical protein
MAEATIAGYDSVADTVDEWRSIVPEPIDYKGSIGSYGNGTFANSTVAKEAFPSARHVIYDVNGSQPEDDILDIEPRDDVPTDAGRWARAHDASQGPHTLPHAALYESASTVSAVVSNMLDAGYARDEFLIHSAHYGHGPHICGPDTCGFPQADGTQYADTGTKGQNTDLNLFMPHFFKQPAPKPDPRYDLFDNVKRSLIQGHTERQTVMQYDVWRAEQTASKHPHRFGLAVRRARLRLLAARLARVLKSEAHAHPNQAWRLRELQDRAAGKRLV